MSYDLQTGKGGAEVTPGVELKKARCLWVGTSGDVNVRFPEGGSAVFTNVVGMLPVDAVEVLASGTTASDITAIF